MAKKKQIFLVYSCDEWKSADSMVLLMATTSVSRLKMFIANEIARGNFEWYGEGNTRAQKAASFKKAFSKETRDALNSALTYGFFDYVYDGEEV